MLSNSRLKPAVLLFVGLHLVMGCGGSDSDAHAGTEANADSAVDSADEVLAHAAENWGGVDRLGALTSVRADFTYDESDGPVTHEIQRPNLVRSTGGDRYTSVFDGQHAAFLHYVDREGKTREPFLVEEDEVKDWELEKAWVFPAFFDYPSEYLGRQEVNGSDTHVLRVELPLGGRVDYFLDAESFLVIRAEGLTTIGGTTYESGRDYLDFQEFDGIRYPTRMAYYYGEGEPQTGTIGPVEFNVTFPADHFLIPETIFPGR